MKVILSLIFEPLSWLYALVTSLRNYAYDFGILKTNSSDLSVISIGNITVGGNGKTPAIISLVQYYQKMGRSPVVLTRGYGGSMSGPCQVNLTNSFLEVGDEPLLIKAETGVPVVLARSRTLGAKFIAKNKLGNLILLDDGMQHRALNRDLNLMLVDVSDPRWELNYLQAKLLPAGRFRESLKQGIKRVDQIILVNRSLVQVDWDICQRQATRLFGSSKKILCAELVLTGVTQILGQKEPLAATKVLAFSGIAAPQAFFSSLKSLGFEIIKQQAFRDHYQFTQKDLDQLIKAAAGSPIVCTTKDAIKLRGLSGTEQLFCLKTELKLHDYPDYKPNKLAIKE